MNNKQKKKPLRILVLTFGFPTFTGEEKGFLGGSFIVPEVLSYIRSGAQVTVLTLHGPGLKAKEIVNKDFNIIRVPYFFPFSTQLIRIPNYPLYTKKFLFFRLFQLPFFLMNYLAYLFYYVFKNDIVHANWTPTAFLALPFGILFNRPIFLTFRGSDLTKLPTKFNRFIIKHVDAVFKWELGDVTKFMKLFKGNYVRLPLIADMGLRKNILKTIPQHENTIVKFTYIGRVSDDPIQRLKGLMNLIPAAAKLICDYQMEDRFRIDFVGDGPAIDALKAQVNDLQMGKYVVFHGHQADVFPFLKSSHAILGGIGLNAVVKESAFSNRLIMMVQGEEWTGSIWKDQVNAVVYNPNDIDSLALSMKYVIDNPEKCKEIAEQGNITIRKYAATVEKGGQAYIDLFKKLIKGREKKK